MKDFAIEMIEITKTFGNLVANNNITLKVPTNSIYGIIGENGAGKSTLMSVLFGLYRPDSGEIKIHNSIAKIKSPHDANRYGIGMVHQHFKLVGAYNAVDNIILGNEIHRFGILDRKKALEKISSLAKNYDFDIDLKQPVSKLTVGQQQKVEILKTLFLDSKILIFDEPTAVLTPQEIEGFLKLLLKFKDEGKTIVLITHKLEEIKKVCSLATVIRHGHVIDEVVVSKTSTSEMAKLMVGSEVHETKNNLPVMKGKTVLQFKNVNYKKLNNVSFSVHEGEIVAVAGVEGNGQSEIINLIVGFNNPSSGSIYYLPQEAKNNPTQLLISKHLGAVQKIFNTNNFSFKKVFDKVARRYKGSAPQNASSEKVASDLLDISYESINKRIKMGIAHIPEDRHKHGLILDMKIKYNIAIKKMKDFSLLGVILENKISNYAKNVINLYDVRGAHQGDSLAKQLSGGNQQKAIIGREIESKHNFIVIAQPTRGLDVGAILNVHNRIIEEKAKKKAVLLLSYELTEVMSLADRIIVVNKGSIVGELSAKGAKREDIGLLMAGITSSSKLEARSGGNNA